MLISGVNYWQSSRLVGVAIEDRIVRSLGKPLGLNIGAQNHHSGRVHLDLDLGLGAQYSVVDLLVEILKENDSINLSLVLQLEISTLTSTL